MNWTELEAEIKSALRAKRGSQSEVARRLGIKHASVSGYVSGSDKIPPDHLNTILDLLGWDLRVEQKESPR